MEKDNRFELLKFYKEQGNKRALAKEIRRMSKALNQRFRELEKRGLQGDSYAYKYARSETGKDKPRYTESMNVLMNYDLNTLFEQGLQVNVKMYSSSSSIPVVRATKEKKLTKAIQTLQDEIGEEIDYNDFENFLKLGGGELMNYKYLDSTQVVEDFIEFTKSGNISTKEFIREFKRYKKRMNKGLSVDIGKIRRNLSNLARKKKKR